jgi:uncharacterized protein YqiB (DUF1249 family)
MQAPSSFLVKLDLTGAEPTVGGLMALCEENYDVLLRLAPGLSSARGVLVSRHSDCARLQLEVLEQSRYTTVLRLTHLFPAPEGAAPWQPEPDAVLKAYHDAGQVEVLDLRQTALPIFSHYRSPALLAKWKANLFVSKWLGYCVRGGHRIAPPVALPPQPTRPAPSIA